MKNKFTALFFAVSALSLQAQAVEIESRVCGKVSSQLSPYGDRDVDGSGYSVKLDCRLDGKKKIDRMAPVAIIEEISPARRGWITRWTQGTVNHKARKKGVKSLRATAPYVCMDVVTDRVPCTPGDKTMKIKRITHMTNREVDAYQINRQ